jgi:N-glycosylase/DNA lyase
MPASPWSDWQPLALNPPPRDARVLAELLDGGQAFRWRRLAPTPALRSLGDAGSSPSADPAFHVLRETPPGETPPKNVSSESWRGTWSDCIAEVRLANGELHWRAPATIASKTKPLIARYFGGEQDQAALLDSLPWRSDVHLARCLEEFRGLRILQQPFGETLLGFLCSATKQIVQIKQMLALLAERHGSPVERVDPNAWSDPSQRIEVNALHQLPTWPELALIPEVELRACLLGFRARYIHQTAKFIAANPGWLEETERLPYAEAKVRLCSLPGVGEKVADCVLLFGAGRLEAFPVDVWILKTMAARYGLAGWKPAQVAQFGRAHFGPLAGLAQQYLFAYERRHRGR